VWKGVGGVVVVREVWGGEVGEVGKHGRSKRRSGKIDRSVRDISVCMFVNIFMNTGSSDLVWQVLLLLLLLLSLFLPCSTFSYSYSHSYRPDPAKSTAATPNKRPS
jgi:hypothetical protein